MRACQKNMFVVAGILGGSANIAPVVEEASDWSVHVAHCMDQNPVAPCDPGVHPRCMLHVLNLGLKIAHKPCEV